MRFIRIFKILLVVVPLLLIAAVVGGIAVLKSMDFNRFKPEIATEVRKATGRKLEIAGDLKVNISLNPSLTATDVSLANADWGTQPDMAKIARFEAQIAVLPLILGRLDIERLVLVGADILLERNADGQTNFDFGKPKPANEKGTTGKLEIPIGAREIMVEKSVLTYRDLATQDRYQGRVDQMDLKSEGHDQPISMRFKGSYNGAPISAYAALGTPAELLSSQSPWPVDMTIEAGGATANVKGTIADPPAAKGIDLAIKIKGDQVGDLGALAGSRLPELGAYSVSGSLTGDATSALTLSDLTAKLATSDLGGKVSLKLDGKRPMVTATLSSTNLDMAVLGGPVGSKSEGKRRGRIFSSEPLPVDALQWLDAKLQFDAKTVEVGGASLEDATLNLSVEDGHLTVSLFRGRLAGGALDGSMKLNTRARPAAVSAKLTLDKLDVGRLAKDMHIANDVEGHANFKADVSGAGHSVAQIMAGLDGETSLVMGEGRMKTGSLNTLIGGPTQVLGDIFAGGSKGYTTVNCAVVRFPIKKGVATAQPMVLDTDLAQFVGSGTVDLGDEKIDLLVKPEPKKPTINTAVPVRVGGTLAHPKYSLETLGVARKLGGVIGLVLFPPAAIVGLGELGVTDDNACIQQAKENQKDGQTKSSEQGNSTGGNILKDVGKGITEGIKGLIGQ
jgi:uncharacterized protein involved in outer membrane biogenesis